MSDAFTHQIFQRIVVKLLQKYKFKSASESSINILADLAIATATQIARQASVRAAHCGRTEVNAYDLLMALSDTGIQFPNLVASCKGLSGQFSPFEYLIRPYPLINQCYTPFYKAQVDSPNLHSKEPSNQNPTDAMLNEIFVPFRANTTISYFEKSDEHPTDPNQPNPPQPETKHPNHIPSFYPQPPPLFTYDETYPSDELPPEEAKKLENKRDEAQRESRKSLPLLTRNTKIDDQSNQITFELNLDQIPKIDKPIARWPSKLKSPYYELTGYRNDNDPEFPAPPNISKNLPPNNKDLKPLIAILENNHKNDNKSDKNDKDDD